MGNETLGWSLEGPVILLCCKSGCGRMGLIEICCRWMGVCETDEDIEDEEGGVGGIV